MMISTRGRYVLRVLIDLAEHSGGGYVPLKAIAERQDISLKYLEKTFPPLVKSGYITGMHGKGGGYKLTRKPEEYKVGDILRITEGDLAPVSCLECHAETCRHLQECRTRPLWEKLDLLINAYFDGITLEDLLQGQIPDLVLDWKNKK